MTDKKTKTIETIKDVLGIAYFVTVTVLFGTLMTGGIFFVVGISVYPEFFGTPNNGELNQ